MRYLGRTRRVSVSWLKESCDSGLFAQEYTSSSNMAADIFTKGVADTDKWQHACAQIRIGLGDVSLRTVLAPTPPLPSTGGLRSIKAPLKKTFEGRPCHESGR